MVILITLFVNVNASWKELQWVLKVICYYKLLFSVSKITFKCIFVGFMYLYTTENGNYKIINESIKPDLHIPKIYQSKIFYLPLYF